jgi:hypothetical protein
MSEYYTSNKQRFADMAMGFIGGIVVNALLLWAISTLSLSLPAFGWLLFLEFIGVLAGVFLSERRFIFIGALAVGLIPVVLLLLLFGSCFMQNLF